MPRHRMPRVAFIGVGRPEQMTTFLIIGALLTVVSGWLPTPPGVALRRPVIRRATLPRLAEEPEDHEFEDFERECFGDEDGCDAWYYGEDPDEEEKVLSADEADALRDRVRSNFEAGKKVTDARISAAEVEAAQERMRSMLGK